MANKFDGYAEAKKIDNRIEKVLKRYPITQQTAKEWRKFSRTIKSSCKLIEAYVTLGAIMHDDDGL